MAIDFIWMTFYHWRRQNEKHYQIIFLPILVYILDVCFVVFVRLKEGLYMFCKDTEQLIDILPHGSGINFDYEIEQKGKRIYIRNAWDYMDENGYYDDVFNFVVCYENGCFKYLHFEGCTRTQYRKIEHAGLRDYLEIMFVELEEKIQEAIA